MDGNDREPGTIVADAADGALSNGADPSVEADGRGLSWNIEQSIGAQRTGPTDGSLPGTTQGIGAWSLAAALADAGAPDARIPGGGTAHHAQKGVSNVPEVTTKTVPVNRYGLRMELRAAREEADALFELAKSPVDAEFFNEAKRNAVTVITNVAATLLKAAVEAGQRDDVEEADSWGDARSELVRLRQEVLCLAPPQAARGPTEESSEDPETESKPEKPLTPLPKWSGNVADYHTWKREAKNYFVVYNQKNPARNLIMLLQPGILPPEAELAVRGCRTFDDFWIRLEQRFSPMEVANEVSRILRDLQPIARRDREEAKRVLGALADYALRMQDNDRSDQLAADLVVNEATEKLGPFAEAFPDWMSLKHPGESVWRVDHIIQYLREKIANLSLRPPPVRNSQSGRKGEDVRSQSGPKPTAGPQALGTRPPPSTADAPPTRQENAPKRGPPVRFQGANPGRVNFTESAEAQGDDDPGEQGAETEPEAGKQHCDESDMSRTPYKLMKVTRKAETDRDHQRFSPTTFLLCRDSGGELLRVVTLIDEGSDMNLISQRAADRLGLVSGETFCLNYHVVGGLLTRKARPATLTISNADGESWNIQVLVVHELTGKATPIHLDVWRTQPHLAKARGHVPEEGEAIELLVGYGLKGLTVPREILSYPGEGADQHPTALRSSLGWTIFGPTEAQFTRLLSPGTPTQVRLSSRVQEDESPNIDLEFTDWCKGELLGVEPTSLCHCPQSVIEESAFLEAARRTVHRATNGRMEVQLPWKEGFPTCFPNNRIVAVSALKNLLKTLDRKGLRSAYDEEMNRIITAYCEEVTINEMDDPCWYLHHFLVENKTKLRVVWNSAATYKGFSLNQGLEKGPNLLNDLMAVIMHFRTKRVAFLGDIEAMFNQVQLAVRDRDFHRFVWNGKDYRWTRLPFGDKSAPDLSIYCLRFLADEHQEIAPLGSTVIKNQSYMDDIAGSCETEEQAEEVIHEIDRILESGLFKIKTWHSNSPELDQTGERETSILGVKWDKAGDTLSIEPTRFHHEGQPWTRRQALSEISQIWDPMGLLGPLLVRPKTNLQRMWDTTLDWDEPLNEELESDWDTAMAELRKAAMPAIPREMGIPDGDAHIHIFCDASEDAYGAAAWLATPTGVSFVLAKTLVAPLKTKTVPRLELLSAQLASRILRHFKKQFPRVKATIWTDSQVVMHWIRTGSKRFKAFVSARLQEIHESVPKANLVFRYVPTGLNPADALTKPTVSSVSELERWLTGPSFLNLPESEWPSEPALFSEELRCSVKGEEKTEKARRKKARKPPQVRALQTLRDPDPVSRLIEEAPSWRELVERVAQEMNLPLNEAVNQCLRRAQVGLSKEGLNQGADGLWRTSGRFEHTDLPDDVKHPILLDGGSRVTTLLVRDAHEETAHSEQKFLINYLHTRRGIKVTKSKTIFREIRASCEKCREMKGRPHTPKMGNLPNERLLYGNAPFSACGIDFVGPLGPGQLVIFTCLTSRVIHLEMSDGKSADDVIGAWRRFTSKRGVTPTYVLTDGAESFKKAKTEILKEISRRAGGPTTRWEISHPRAPHRRGAIEIMVKSVKNSLKALQVANKTMTWCEWEQVISEITYLINERPLFNGESAEATAFTGNSLLFPYKETCQEERTEEILKEAKDMTKRFWEMWYTNVLPKLFERQRWRDDLPNVKEGQRVLIVKQGYGNESAPRKYWPKGMIVKCESGKDGIVRKVIVELQDGRREKHVVQNLVVISKFE